MRSVSCWLSALTFSVALVALLTTPAVADENATAVELVELQARLAVLEDTLAELEACAPECSDECREPHWYENFEIAFGATSLLQGIPGANEHYYPDGGRWDATMSYDFEFMAPVGTDGEFFAALEAGAGDGLDADFGSLTGFNGDAVGDADLAVGEAWYQHSIPADKMRIRFGKVDLSTDFDTNAIANCECSQFLAGAFINNPTLEFPAETGYGAMLWLEPTNEVSLGLGVADANGGWSDVGGTMFKIAELDYSPAHHNREGNYRVYWWQNDSQHEQINDLAITDVSNHGYGLSCDQQVSDQLTMFARYGKQRGDVARVETAWSAGIQIDQPRSWDLTDHFGLAYGVSQLSKEWQALAVDDEVSAEDERLWEFYYNHQVSDQVSITPDIQYIENPAGDAANDNAWVLGLRVQVSL